MPAHQTATYLANGPQRAVIAVDTQGGDHGPAPIIAGLSRFAKNNPDVSFLVFGDEAKLAKLVKRYRNLRDRVDIHHTPETVEMNDKPSDIMRHGQDTSMAAALRAVKDGRAGSCVSCGNTGGLLALSMITLRRLPGVSRPAIAILWPSSNPQGFNVILDVGADVRADPKDLLQYAMMGVSYARSALDLPRPRIGLLNVGTERQKGRPELQDAATLIADWAKPQDCTFHGFVEGGDIPGDTVDVIVTDGFTGNIALKTGEGTASFIRSALRKAFTHNLTSRFAMVLAASSFSRLRKRIDPRRVNGGVFLGLNGTVVKSHGSADATGVAAAVKLAHTLVITDFSGRIGAHITAMQNGETNAEAAQTGDKP
jgi:glycerol-3-phosphate acyltransferase PlsX